MSVSGHTFYIYAYMYICISICISICIYVYIYVYLIQSHGTLNIYIHICIYVYIYVYLQIEDLSVSAEQENYETAFVERAIRKFAKLLQVRV